MTEVSVIIPCFNAERWIREALGSALEQDCDKEIIVVDDGSTDASVKIVKESFPFSVRLIENQHLGVSVARNIGTRQSKAEFIQYLDADDILAPGKLKIQIEELRRTGADVAYGDWQRLEEKNNTSFVNGEIVKRKLNSPEIDLFTDFWCPPAAYLFRRSIVEKIGGWNEDLPVIQDARFVLDCALQKAGFIYCPGIMAFYRAHSAGSVSTRDQAAFARDCFKNANEVKMWWEEHGEMDSERERALTQVYEYVARSSFENDRVTFNCAYEALIKLNPGYIPQKPKYLRFMSLLFGYDNAEKAVFCCRRIKNFVKMQK